MLADIITTVGDLAQILIPVCIGVAIKEQLTRRKYRKMIEEEMNNVEHLGDLRSPPEWEDWDT